MKEKYKSVGWSKLLQYDPELQWLAKVFLTLELFQFYFMIQQRPSMYFIGVLYAISTTHNSDKKTGIVP